MSHVKRAYHSVKRKLKAHKTKIAGTKKIKARGRKAPGFRE